MHLTRVLQQAAVFAALGASTLLSGVASASPLIVDRGLPTANLNNISGASRSNVAWTDGGYTSANDYWLIGDSFTNTSGQTWSIDTIRMWTVGSTATAQLWGGTSGGSIAVVANSGTVSGPVAYADASTYQGSGGSFINMFQVDFAVNITLAAGDTFEFYLDGTGGSYTVPFAHASNAALSGSAQDGSNNQMFGAQVVNGGFDGSTRYTWSSAAGNGWDKGSDLNVQVFGNAVPEPATFALAGLALLGLAATRRRA